MKIPEITEFKFLEEFGYWFATPAGKDEFDILIADKDGKPNDEAYFFVKKAIDDLEFILSRSHTYIREFVDSKKAEIEGEGGLVNIYSGFSENTIKIELNFSTDIYGLWFVEFSWDERNKWWPISFGRKSW